MKPSETPSNASMVLQQVQDLLQADAVGADEYILVSRWPYQRNALPTRRVG